MLAVNDLASHVGIQAAYAEDHKRHALTAGSRTPASPP
jgi:hypothetical protein